MKPLNATLPLVVLVLGIVASAQHIAKVESCVLDRRFSQLPLHFVENRGLYPDVVRYYLQAADRTLFFASDGVTILFCRQPCTCTVKLDFVGARPDVQPEGLDRQQAVFSYFKGAESDWRTGLPTFSKIIYRGLWPGVDLVYRGTVGKLKYAFLVAPGADPELIRLRYRGAMSVTPTTAGALRVTTSEGAFEDAPPVAWQDLDGKRVPVEVAYAVGEDGRFGFALGDYDRTRPLVLDPVVLVYCGYIGGNGSDWPGRLAVDSSGNAYVSGATSSAGSFPATVGPSLTSAGSMDAFVAKVSPAGALVYCGFIGGPGDDYSRGIAVDGAGNAYVVGMTGSAYSSFPVKIGPDLTFNGGLVDAFVAKVNASGTSLVYCGFIGGAQEDDGVDIAVDRAGHAYVVGNTRSTEQTFPVQFGPDLTHNGGAQDAFVAKVNAAGTGLDYCGFIGGAGYEMSAAITVDQNGSAYVTGSTDSDEHSFPVRVGPDLTYRGGAGNQNNDAFVAKIDPIGSSLAYCGYLGGFGFDTGGDVAVDGAGNLYVTGTTASTSLTFPVKVGPDLTFNGGTSAVPTDAFVAKVNAAGSALDFCGYIGGSGNDQGIAIALSPAGDVCVAGGTDSRESTFPVRIGPDLTSNGGADAFIAMVDPSGRSVTHCGYIGGAASDHADGIAVDASGNIHVSGSAYSTEATFPVRVGPDLTHNGGPNPYNQADTFVAKLDITEILATGVPRPGGTVRLHLAASDSVAQSYQLGSSLGSGPIPIDSRTLELSPDALLAGTVNGWWPGIFSGYAGVIDSKGQAEAKIRIPNVAALVGVRLHSAFVTLRPASPSGIKSISNSATVSITR
jgi:hypothetical protein